MEADAYRHTLQPVAPTMERGEEWRSDRWRLLRPEPNSAADSFNRHVHARTDAYRQDQAAFNCPPQRTGLGVGSAAYQASARSAEMCWPSDKNNETNVYVNGLPEEMNDHMLYLLGSACGVVISHKSMLDRQTGLCKGFGFLMYASSEMAKKAIQWLNSHGFFASFAKESFSARLRRMADTSSTNVYLSNLPLKFTTQQLEQLFAPYPIASLKILYDVHGESRGVGFVRVYDRATAKECIDRLHGRMLPGTTLPLQVRFADSEAQKHLKHSMSQKHTLESLGLGPFVAGDARAVGDHALQYPGIERIRSASELDAAVAHAQKMAKSKARLGTQLPTHPMWARTHVVGVHSPGMAPHLGFNSTGMMPSEESAEVMYAGPKGACTFGRPLAMSPLVAGRWEQSNGLGGLPKAFIPPPGLTHPANAVQYLQDTGSLLAEETCDDRPDTTKPLHGGSRHLRHRNRQASARVRCSANSGADATQRAVSDPMAMLAAQTRIREALGLRERVRAAVSADNSIDEAQHAIPTNNDGCMRRSESISSIDQDDGGVDNDDDVDSCVEDDSLSVELLINGA